MIRVHKKLYRPNQNIMIKSLWTKLFQTWKNKEQNWYKKSWIGYIHKKKYSTNQKYK